MRIAVTSQDGQGDFNRLNSGPWEYFFRELENRGHKIVSLFSKPDVIVFNNYSNQLYRRFAVPIPNKQKILISWEPPSNLPAMFAKENLAKFGSRFFPSFDWAKTYHGQYFDWPQSTFRQSNSLEQWRRRFPRFCMIQGNRWSVFPGENYSLRRKILRQSEEEIDLYGVGWNQGWSFDIKSILRSSIKSFKEVDWVPSHFSDIGHKYSNYKGVADDKLEIMSQYQFSIVIENSNDYLTEKFFDALISGTVPIYVGGKLENYGISSEIAIVANPSVSDVLNKMKFANSNIKASEQVLRKGYSFLASTAASKHSGNSSLASLGSRVSEAIL